MRYQYLRSVYSLGSLTAEAVRLFFLQLKGSIKLACRTVFFSAAFPKWFLSKLLTAERQGEIKSYRGKVWKLILSRKMIGKDDDVTDTCGLVNPDRSGQNRRQCIEQLYFESTVKIFFPSVSTSRIIWIKPSSWSLKTLCLTIYWAAGATVYVTPYIFHLSSQKNCDMFASPRVRFPQRFFSLLQSRIHYGRPKPAVVSFQSKLSRDQISIWVMFTIYFFFRSAQLFS